MARMTIGEAARERLLEISKRDGSDPYKLLITCGDHALLHEIAKKARRRGDDHAWDCVHRIIAGIRRSPLFEIDGYAQFPGYRGMGKITCFRLKRPKK